MQVQDQLERNFQLKETPKRIISLVPSQTELLVDLGLREQLVGITKFCVHPVELRKEVEVVGGTKEVKLEKIGQLQPDPAEVGRSFQVSLLWFHQQLQLLFVILPDAHKT